jgi:hypothetical protein
LGRQSVGAVGIGAKGVDVEGFRLRRQALLVAGGRKGCRRGEEAGRRQRV